jgi:hypothetical protein
MYRLCTLVAACPQRTHAMAGRAGARMAAVLHASVSRSTLLRMLAALPDPAAPTPRVLGVDDFALLRGQNYGTVLIDCETGAPVELLPGRHAVQPDAWPETRQVVDVGTGIDTGTACIAI